MQEHSITLDIKLPQRDVNRKMPVFYNPLMVSNRNISILLLNSVNNKGMNIALPLSGSGIRGMRFLKELNKGIIKKIFFNDIKENFERDMNQRLEKNGLQSKKIEIINQDANKFLTTQHTGDWCGYWDYIDLDPFGTPNPFLSTAVERITRDGILAVTATDTAALTGTYSKVTLRKYWAKSLRNYMMHEIGLRILIRKVQLLGVQFDKALIPVLAYSKDHYYRIYFKSTKGKVKCDNLLSQHMYYLSCPRCLNYKQSMFNYEKCKCGSNFDFAGPMWVGKLQDKILVKKMLKINKFQEDQKFLEILVAENDIFGFHDLHAIAKKYKKEPPRMENLTNVTRTHFSPTGVKTKKLVNQLLRFYK